MWRDPRYNDMYGLGLDPRYRRPARTARPREDPDTSLLKEITELRTEFMKLNQSHEISKTRHERQMESLIEQLNIQIQANIDLKKRVEKLEKLVRSPHVVDIEELEEKSQRNSLGVDSDQLLVESTAQ